MAITQPIFKLGPADLHGSQQQMQLIQRIHVDDYDDDNNDDNDDDGNNNDDDNGDKKNVHNSTRYQARTFRFCFVVDLENSCRNDDDNGDNDNDNEGDDNNDDDNDEKSKRP